MKKFNFYQDEKITIWQRNNFTIEADNEEQARKIAKQKIKELICDDNSSSITFIDSELLLDTLEVVTVEEDNGYSTLETYDWEGNLIGTNAD